MGTLLDKPVTEKHSEGGADNDLVFGVSEMQGWRVDMEDAHTLIGKLTAPVAGPSESSEPPDRPGGGGNDLPESLPDHSLFGVYDGHGGQFAAIYSAANVVRCLWAQDKFLQYYKNQGAVNADELLGEAMKGCFLMIDEDMKNTPEMRDKRDRSGCTAICVMLTPTSIVCANAGDSRACYCTNGTAVELSRDHKPYLNEERERIEKAGGYVTMKRVDGDLAVSRALGDFQYKDRDDLPAEEQKVTALPVIMTKERAEKDEFIIIACDGIWDVVSNEECVEMVQKILDEGERDPKLIAEEVIDQCLEKNSRDNMTANIILMKGTRYGEGGGVAARREQRRLAEEEKAAEEEREREEREASQN